MTMKKAHWEFCLRHTSTLSTNARYDGGSDNLTVRLAFWIWLGSSTNAMTSHWSVYRRHCKRLPKPCMTQILTSGQSQTCVHILLISPLFICPSTGRISLECLRWSFQRLSVMPVPCHGPTTQHKTDGC